MTDEQDPVRRQLVIKQLRGLGLHLVVVSASKSGAEVALALGRVLTPAETSHVRAWVSIGGVLRGSPVADRIVGSVFCSLVRFGVSVPRIAVQPASPFRLGCSTVYPRCVAVFFVKKREIHRAQSAPECSYTLYGKRPDE